MSPTFAVASSAAVMVERVHRRLEAAGAVIELDTLGRLSAQEMDVLARLERTA